MKTQIINIPTQRKIKAIITIENGKKFTGVATCLPTDTFNQQFGEELALRKAKVKMFTHLAKQAKKEFDLQDKLSDDALKMFFKAENNLDKVTQKLDLELYLLDELVA